MSAYDVVVVGSANLDLAIPVDRAPRQGETVLGGDVVEGPGGKGLNQAVACARLGRRTAFVGAVGDDEAGRMLRELLEAEGITALLAPSDKPTGRAVVLTDSAGDSTITVSPGANTDVDPMLFADEVRGARAVLVQLEISEPAVGSAAELAEGLFVLNPAPGRAVPADVLERVDVLVPNGHELAVLAGEGDRPTQEDDASAMARRLGLRATVVVTLGERGAVVLDADGVSTSVPAVAVDVVDATAAGDTFCAALVDGLLDGRSAAEAAAWAASVAAVTVTRKGAALSVPRRDEFHH